MQKYKYLYVNGDSYTFGLDLEQKRDVARNQIHSKYRWSNILSEKLGCIEVNQAKCGSSNDRIVRTLFDWYINSENKHKDTFVIIGWTLPHRFESFSEGKWEQRNVGVGWVTSHNFIDINGQIIDDEIYKRDFINHLVLVQSFLKVNNIEYLFFIVHDDGITTSLENLKNNPLLDFENIMDITFNDFSEDIQNEKIWGYRHPNRLSHKLWAKKLYDKIR
jgi:hypothetical protein